MDPRFAPTFLAAWLAGLLAIGLGSACDRADSPAGGGAKAPVEAGARDRNGPSDEELARVHAGLLTGPGGGTLESDPCPGGAGAPRGCERLVSARRISWYGYTARWMRVFRLFAVPVERPEYATLPSDALDLGVAHPEAALLPRTEPGGERSQFAVLHDVLGEPSDQFGVEATTLAEFRAEHSFHLTAAAVKQGCRISTYLSARLAEHLTASSLPAAELEAVERVLDIERGGTSIRRVLRFRPEFGYLAYGRRLADSEFSVVNGTLGAGSGQGDGFMGFRSALSALMCSTSALVE